MDIGPAVPSDAGPDPELAELIERAHAGEHIPYTNPALWLGPDDDDDDNGDGEWWHWMWHYELSWWHEWWHDDVDDNWWDEWWWDDRFGWVQGELGEWFERHNCRRWRQILKCNKHPPIYH